MPARQQPESYTARREVTLLGVTYAPGDTVPLNVIKAIHNLSALVSSRVLVPDTDPHQRKTRLESPTPTDYPASVRRGIPDGA